MVYHWVVHIIFVIKFTEESLPLETTSEEIERKQKERRRGRKKKHRKNRNRKTKYKRKSKKLKKKGKVTDQMRLVNETKKLGKIVATGMRKESKILRTITSFLQLMYRSLGSIQKQLHNQGLNMANNISIKNKP